MIQITDLTTEKSISPILRLGFRPFFLLAPAFALFALALWLLLFHGKANLSTFGGGYWWHTHEMIFGFASAIVAGFLLTAVQTWTGIRSVHGNPLLLLVTLWLLARVLLLLPNYIPHIIISIVDLSFLPLTAWLLAKPIIAIRQYRNLFFVPMLLLFTLVNLQMHLSLYIPGILINYSAFSGVMLITLLMAIIAGRVTPMFTANGTNTKKVTNLAWLEKIANGGLVLLFLLFLIHPLLTPNHNVIGMLFILVGLLQAFRFTRWRPWITFNVPLLWSIHVSLFFIWTSLVLLGVGYFFGKLPTNHLWHLLTIGGMTGLIFAMISRVSLGHTGRPLVVGKLIQFAFILIFLSAFIRAILPIIYPELAPLFYWIATLSSCGAILLYLYRYVPMLVAPRVDNRPG